MATAKIHVASLPYSFGDQELRDLFSTFGAVRSARVMMDRDTGRSRGFGFVEMDAVESAQRAIAELNGKDCEGLTLRVSEAREREPRPAGSGSPQGAGPRPAAAEGSGGGRSFGPPRAPAWQRERERQERNQRRPIKGRGPRRDDDGDADDIDRDV